jgi:hypothetical protein
MASFRNPIAPTPKNLIWMAVMNLVFVVISVSGALVLGLFFAPHFDSIATQDESFGPRLNHITDSARLQHILLTENDSVITLLRDSAHVALSLSGFLGALCLVTFLNGVSFILAARRVKADDQNAAATGS